MKCRPLRAYDSNFEGTYSGPWIERWTKVDVPRRPQSVERRARRWLMSALGNIDRPPETLRNCFRWHVPSQFRADGLRREGFGFGSLLIWFLCEEVGVARLCGVQVGSGSMALGSRGL